MLDVVSVVLNLVSILQGWKNIKPDTCSEMKVYLDSLGELGKVVRTAKKIHDKAETFNAKTADLRDKLSQRFNKLTPDDIAISKENYSAHLKYMLEDLPTTGQIKAETNHARGDQGILKPIEEDLDKLKQFYPLLTEAIAEITVHAERIKNNNAATMGDFGNLQAGLKSIDRSLTGLLRYADKSILHGSGLMTFFIYQAHTALQS